MHTLKSEFVVHMDHFHYFFKFGINRRLLSFNLMEIVVLSDLASNRIFVVDFHVCRTCGNSSSFHASERASYFCGVSPKFSL